MDKYAAILKDAKALLEPNDFSKFVAALKDAEARFAKGVVVDMPVNLGEPPWTGIYGNLWDFMSSHGGWFIEILKAVPGRLVVHVTVDVASRWEGLNVVTTGKTADAQKLLDALRALNRKHDLFYLCCYAPQFSLGGC